MKNFMMNMLKEKEQHNGKNMSKKKRWKGSIHKLKTCNRENRRIDVRN